MLTSCIPAHETQQPASHVSTGSEPVRCGVCANRVASRRRWKLTAQPRGRSHPMRSVSPASEPFTALVQTDHCMGLPSSLKSRMLIQTIASRYQIDPVSSRPTSRKRSRWRMPTCGGQPRGVATHPAQAQLHDRYTRHRSAGGGAPVRQYPRLPSAVSAQSPPGRSRCLEDASHLVAIAAGQHVVVPGSTTAAHTTQAARSFVDRFGRLGSHLPDVPDTWSLLRKLSTRSRIRCGQSPPAFAPQLV
jgi:hypothetical protein